MSGEPSTLPFTGPSAPLGEVAPCRIPARRPAHHRRARRVLMTPRGRTVDTMKRILQSRVVSVVALLAASAGALGACSSAPEATATTGETLAACRCPAGQ